MSSYDPHRTTKLVHDIGSAEDRLSLRANLIAWHEDLTNAGFGQQDSTAVDTLVEVVERTVGLLDLALPIYHGSPAPVD